MISCNEFCYCHVLVPFIITTFPEEELQLDPHNSFTLQCVVTVDKQFPLEAVSVTIQYSPVSLDDNPPSQIYANREEVNEERRTLTVKLPIENIELKYGGTYGCTAETKPYKNAFIPQFSTYNRTRIIKASPTACEL